MPYSNGLTQVEFKDEEDNAVENGQMQIDFEDNDALLDDLDPVGHPPSTRAGRPWRKVLFISLALAAIGMGAYFLIRPNGADSSNDNSINTLTAPPANLSAKCVSVSDECRMACEPADCCDFPSNLELSCLKGNEDQCLTYHQHCSILHGGQPAVSSSPIPRAPSNLKDVCTTEKVATVDGFQECEEACEAPCCYEDTTEGTCTNEECNDYAPCLILSATDHIHDSIPKHVAEQCLDLDTVSGRAGCRIACSHALCCFAKGHICPHPDDAFCSQYSICDDLQGDVNVVATAKEVSQMCASDHTSMCELVCARAACCFSAERCPTEDIKCEDYSPCAVLYGDTQDDDTVTGGGDNDDTVFKADVDKACINFDPAGAQASDSKCTKLCADVGCCFTDEAAACTDKIDCLTYEGCVVVYGGGEDDDDLGTVFKADVDDACIDFDPAAVGASASECSKLCAGVGCCFSDPATCSDEITCQTYEGCVVVYGAGDDQGDNNGGTVFKADVDAACIDFDPAAVGASASECTKLCADVDCCFKDPALCSDTLNCQTYEGCVVVYGDDEGDNNVGTVFKADVDKACIDFDPAGSYAIDSKCAQLCADVGCCFTDEGAACSDTIDCLTYEGCVVVYETGEGGGDQGDNNGGTVFKADVDDACIDFDPAAVGASTSECTELCADVGCCFTNPTTCSDEITCQTYEGCVVVYGADDNGDDQGDNNVGTVFKADVDKSCVDFDPAAAGASTSECSKLCADVGCCFTDPATCSDEISCQTFEGCVVVYGAAANNGDNQGGDSLGLIFKADVDDACIDFDPAAVQASASECTKLCADVGCCFTDPATCPDTISCLTYKECDIIYDVEEETSSSGGGENSGGNVMSTAGQIYEACDKHGVEIIATPGGTTLCSTLCESYRCCFDGCDTSGLDCGEGAGCIVVFPDEVSGGESDTESLHDTIMSTCEEGSDREKCKSLCHEGRCCFPSQGCKASSDVTCTEYQGCLVVYAVDGEDELPAVQDSNEHSAEDIASACSGGAVSSMCSTLCNPSECCFRSSSMTCNPSMDCNKYSVCSKVWGR